MRIIRVTFSLAIMLTTVSSFAAPEINYVNGDKVEALWQSQFEDLLFKKVLKNVPLVQQPKKIHIIKSSSSYRYVFYTVKKVLSLGDFNPEMITHELGHVFLDSYLREKSLGWTYFLAMVLAGAKDIPSAIKSNEKALSSFNAAKKEFKQKGLPIKNILSSINVTEYKLKLLYKVAPYESLYERSFPQANYNSILAPYHELFADCLSVLVAGDWNVMVPAVKELVDEYDISLSLPEGMSLELYLPYRGFTMVLDKKNYKYSKIEEQNNYTQFPVFRSFFRETYESDLYEPKFMLEALGEAIVLEFESLVQQPIWNPLTLKEKNARLIKTFKERLLKEK